MRSIKTPRTGWTRRFGLRLPLVLPFVLWLVPALAAQPADEVLKEFKITGDFVLEVDGKVLEGSEVFFSERAVAYLVMAPQLPSPILISPRSKAVESVHLMKVMKKDAGTVDILSDAELTPISSFHLDKTSVVFKLEDGKEARLIPKPWLLGRHDGGQLRDYNAEYAFEASQYQPGSENIAALRNQSKDVRVRVYFGSWCPHCKQLLPRILKVEEELQGSEIRFEYYGLPSPLTDDPETDRVGINGVPTAVIFIDGKEGARLTGNDLQVPEAALRQAVGA